MKSKITSMLQLLGFFGFVSVVGTADAANDVYTSAFKIAKIEASVNGLKVTRDGGGVEANPASCASTDYYEPLQICSSTVTTSCMTQDQRELFEKVIIAAHLAGRAVIFRLNGTSNICGPTNRPAYESVTLAL